MPEIQKSLVEPNITVMEVSGRITLGRECQRVEWAIEEFIEGKQTKLVLDLSKLEYIDSAGIGIIVTCSGKLGAAGGEMKIASLQPRVADLMRVTKLDRIMRFYPTVDEAVQSFES